MKGYIFDLDGTMVDNMMVHHRAWQKLLSKLGLEMSLEEIQESIHGINEEIVRRLFGDKYSEDEVKRIAAEKEAMYREVFKPDLELVEGLGQFLERCRSQGILIGVATAAPAENLDFIMDTLNIRSLFETIIHAGDVTKGKPDPEVYLKAAEELGLEPKDCLVFEDSPTGAQSAVNAGMKVIVITTTHVPDDFKNIPVASFIENYTDINIDSLLN